jgi:hypothetical protein
MANAIPGKYEITLPLVPDMRKKDGQFPPVNCTTERYAGLDFRDRNRWVRLCDYPGQGPVLAAQVII